MTITYFVTCPVCHGKIVSLTPIINVETTEVYGYHGYCCSLKCRVKRVTFDRDFRAISFTKWSSLNEKRKFLYETIKTKRKNGNYSYKKKTNKKWKFLKNSFNSFKNSQ